MPATPLSLALLVVASFGLTTWLVPWYEHWLGDRAQSANVLTVLLGDSRRLFAQHFYAKADAYFHSGYYPSIFDQRPSSDRLRMASGGTSGAEGGHTCATTVETPDDWIARFSRHFRPSTHVHLGEAKAECKEPHAAGAACQHQGHADESAAGEERELLPWLRIAADLDPQRPETYVIASFWLRSRLGKVTEAEQFLREGLRANPGHPEILFELGRVYREHRQDSTRARNVWELALAKWDEQSRSPTPPDRLLHLQLLGQLAKLEEEQKHYAQAIGYLKLLKEVSPSKEHIQKWIDELQAKAAP